MSDGFTLVKPKKSKSTRNQQHGAPKFHNDSDLNETLDEKRCQDLKGILLDYKFKLAHSDQHNYWRNFKDSLNEFLDSCSDLAVIKCYGLGSIDHNINSRYQFSLLLLLVDELRITSVDFYDPIFNLNDKHLIEQLFGFNLIKRNEEAKCKVNEGASTLFYMPHCGKPLYNNLLYSNWSLDSLNKLYLIGNSFELLNTMTLDADLGKYYTYIKYSNKFLIEKQLNSKCQLTDAFSDLSLHKFKPVNESDLGNCYLQSPVYECNDEIVFEK